MFELEDVRPAPYEDPWLDPVQVRLRRLAAGAVRIAYFYECPDNSTFRYRIYNMAQVLNDGTGRIAASYFFLADVARFDEIADLAHVLVICRARFDHTVDRLINAFRLRRKRVLFDTDDFVFNVDYVHLLVETLDHDLDNPQVWQDWFSYLGRIGATLKRCDGAITTTSTLARRIEEFADLPVAVVPNFMNREQLAMSERVADAKRGRRLAESGLIHFGYFSGSPSHNRDFAIVVPALEELLHEQPGVGLVVVGYIEAGPRLERFGSRVQRMNFHDFINLQRLVGTVEFNLMPLQLNVFTNCKSELKYFEAAAVGTVSIASPTETYARAVEHGHTGYLARAHEWARVLRQALADLDGYQSMADRSRVDALSKYSWAVQRPRILAALGLPAEDGP